MDKKEIRQDLVREKLIEYAGYISNNKNIAIQAIIITCILIGSFSFFIINRNINLNHTSEISGLAQTKYNLEPSDISLFDLQEILDDYEKTPGASQAYVYLVYDAYIKDDFEKLRRLLDSYSFNLDDPLLKSSQLETKGNLMHNDGEYDKAISLFKKALEVNDVFTLQSRYKLDQARVYIDKKDFKKAKILLNELEGNSELTRGEKNNIEELLSYLKHISK